MNICWLNKKWDKYHYKIIPWCKDGTSCLKNKIGTSILHREGDNFYTCILGGMDNPP